MSTPGRPAQHGTPQPPQLQAAANGDDTSTSGWITSGSGGGGGMIPTRAADAQAGQTATVGADDLPVRGRARQTNGANGAQPRQNGH